MPDTFDLLKELTESPGPSGYEVAIAAAVEAQWRPLVDDLTVDRVGSVVGVKRATAPSQAAGPRFRVLLAAHLDEIGLMVADIKDHNGYGFIRVSATGGVDRRHLLGQLVTVHGRRDLPAVIGALPDSMLPEKKRDKAYSFEDLAVDTGLPAADLRGLVSIGDIVTFHQPLRSLGNGKASGKSLDNRASITAITLALRHLQTRSHRWDVVAVATSQEETTYLGGYTAGYAQRPDVAIAIDVTHAKGPGTNDGDRFELGGSPVIEIGPNVHPGVTDALRSAAEALELTPQVSTHTAGSGTDAYPLQVAREGIPTGLLSIPLRYMHTMVETADLADIERTGRVLAEFIARLDDDFVQGLRDGLMTARTAANGDGKST
jgi:endoglucanase